MSLPDGPFGCILADPPWSFLTYGKRRTVPHRGENDHYDTMTLEDMQTLPVGDVADKNCALFMWVVDSHFDVALDLGRAWGFQFKTCAFVWTKESDRDLQLNLILVPRTHPIGMGYWTRKQTEQCWLFTRGKPRRLDKGVRQVLSAPRREHSRKPEEIHGRIERLVGGPYLEMFARAPREGWISWGNETEKFS